MKRNIHPLDDDAFNVPGIIKNVCFQQGHLRNIIYFYEESPALPVLLQEPVITPIGVSHVSSQRQVNSYRFYPTFGMIPEDVLEILPLYTTNVTYISIRGFLVLERSQMEVMI
jgi:hypothetical protein